MERIADDVEALHFGFADLDALLIADRPAMVAAVMDAIRKGGLFAVDVDIIPTKIGETCHVWFPAATSGEMDLTSMNG